jgi:squalene-associated FAD-dependent desaturase
MTATTHIIGAGLAGLSAAVRLAGAGMPVVVHEATAQAGGRCRSYHDPVTDMVIDNGSHLLLSGNHAALSFLRAIGAEDQLAGPEEATFRFFDLRAREGWTLRLGRGRLPWWILNPKRRVPGSRLGEYFRIAPLLLARRNDTVGDRMRCEGALYERLIRPLMVAALNVEPAEGSAPLARAVLLETMALSGRTCRPLIAQNGLSDAFVDPAIAHLRGRGGEVIFGHQLRAIERDGSRVTALDFGTDRIVLAADDKVVLAVPAYAAAHLLPGLVVPSQFRAILNLHFRAAPPPGTPPLIGVVNGTCEWIFSYADRMSVTISNADRLMNAPRPALAQTIWREICDITGLAGDLPRWQIVRERRATFATTPAENAKRPGTRTQWSNLVLAGDWTATGLPPTIEGSVRSGQHAAEAVAEDPI